MKEFKDKLSDLLKEKGINTIQFADILGISQPLVSQWLAGEKRTKNIYCHWLNFQAIRSLIG